nr:flavin reductase family protein [uncultured Cellulomonas sp.]
MSLNPPLVSISFARSSTTWPLLRRAQQWGITRPAVAMS